MGLDIYFQSHKVMTREQKNGVEVLFENYNGSLTKSEAEVARETIHDCDLGDFYEVKDYSHKDENGNIVEIYDLHACGTKEELYFRKVNFLLPHFGYEENCSNLEISKCQVEDLVENCNKVLADHSLADELLPSKAGFFFGSTDYDEWYFNDVESVRDSFEKLLNEFDFDNNTLEMHCWW